MERMEKNYNARGNYENWTIENGKTGSIGNGTRYLNIEAYGNWRYVDGYKYIYGTDGTRAYQGHTRAGTIAEDVAYAKEWADEYIRTIVADMEQGDEWATAEGIEYMGAIRIYYSIVYGDREQTVYGSIADYVYGMEVEDYTIRYHYDKEDIQDGTIQEWIETVATIATYHTYRGKTGDEATNVAINIAQAYNNGYKAGYNTEPAELEYEIQGEAIYTNEKYYTYCIGKKIDYTGKWGTRPALYSQVADVIRAYVDRAPADATAVQIQTVLRIYIHMDGKYILAYRVPMDLYIQPSHTDKIVDREDIWLRICDRVADTIEQAILD